MSSCFYQTALIGRRDLDITPDARMGFEMTLLRMLAFRPGAAPPRGPRLAEAGGTSSPAATQASPTPEPATQSPGNTETTAAQPARQEPAPAPAPEPKPATLPEDAGESPPGYLSESVPLDAYDDGMAAEQDNDTAPRQRRASRSRGLSPGRPSPRTQSRRLRSRLSPGLSPSSSHRKMRPNRR